MKPFEPASIPKEETLKSMQALEDAWKKNQCADLNGGKPMTEDEYRNATVTIASNAAEAEMWLNDIYQVAVYKNDKGPLIHLSIKRRDRKPIHDWRDLQEIKNLLVGRENEGVELFPAESRRVDTSNQYHMFVLKDPAVRFPFGFNAGRVVTEATFGKSVQRPLPKDHA
jgi:hypothetical protein